MIGNKQKSIYDCIAKDVLHGGGMFSDFFTKLKKSSMGLLPYKTILSPFTWTRVVAGDPSVILEFSSLTQV